MAPIPMMKEILLLMNVTGSSPINQNALSRIRAIGTIILLVHLSTEFLLKAIFYWDVRNSIEPLTMWCVFNVGIYKTIYPIIRNKEFCAILNDIEQFWSWENLELDFQRTIRQIFQSGVRSIKSFVVIAIFTMFMFLIRPLLVSFKTLPFDTYHPTNRNTPFYYQLTYALQVIDGVVAFCGFIGFDALFVCLIIPIICELKIVKQKLSIINVGDEENCLKEINQLVDHHNLVLRCIKNLDQLYAAMLLVQFSCSILLIGSGLFFVASGGFPPDLRKNSNFVLYLLTSSFELFLYCLAGTYIINETESISDAVYQSDWWVKTQPKFRRACVLIIQRANKTEYLTAGGMFVLNLESFTKIMKLAFSFFSLTQATLGRVST